MRKEYIERLGKALVGVPTMTLVHFANEMRSLVGFTEDSATKDLGFRDAALNTLVLIALVANNNPLLDLVAEFGELPAEITLLIPSAAPKASAQ